MEFGSIHLSFETMLWSGVQKLPAWEGYSCFRVLCFLPLFFRILFHPRRYKLYHTTFVISLVHELGLGSYDLVIDILSCRISLLMELTMILYVRHWTDREDSREIVERRKNKLVRMLINRYSNYYMVTCLFQWTSSSPFISIYFFYSSLARIVSSYIM